MCVYNRILPVSFYSMVQAMRSLYLKKPFIRVYVILYSLAGYG